LEWSRCKGLGQLQLLLESTVRQGIQNIQVYFDAWQALAAYNHLGQRRPGHHRRSQSHYNNAANRQIRAEKTGGLI